MPIRALITLLLAFFAPLLVNTNAHAAPAVSTLPQQTTDAIDALARSTLHAEQIPGLSLAVVQDGKVAYAQGYGFANIEQKAPARAETVYPIGSLTKQFTAAAILTLAQSGKLKSLDKPIFQLLPKLKLPPAWSAITVRELLNQTSGLSDYTGLANSNPDTDPFLKHYTPQETVNIIAAKPLKFTPGTQFDYCNSNYYLLGEIVAEQSGQTYDAYVRDKLFAPLDMSATGQYDPGVVTPRRASGYLLSRNVIYDNILENDADYPGGAGDTQSSVLDLAKWDAALYTDSPLSAGSKTAMWTAPKLAQPPAYPYGFGWIVDQRNGHRLLWHNGAIAGAGSWIGRYVDDRLTVIVQCNLFSLDNPRGFVHQLAVLGEQVAAICNPALAPRDAAADAGGPPRQADAIICRKVFDDILDGHVNPDDYTPAAAKALIPGALIQTQDIWLTLGKLQSFNALGERPVSAYQVVRCRCTFDKAALVYDFALDKNTGKIAGILPVNNVK